MLVRNEVSGVNVARVLKALSYRSACCGVQGLWHGQGLRSASSRAALPGSRFLGQLCKELQETHHAEANQLGNKHALIHRYRRKHSQLHMVVVLIIQAANSS